MNCVNLFIIDKIEKEKRKKLYQSLIKEKDDLYLLEMFMYTSGNVHTGHIRVFSAVDLLFYFFSYKKHNVFRPVGWDAFGLPAEMASINNNIHPRDWTNKNIQQMKETLLSYNLRQNWNTEINTSEQSYYKFDQEIFYHLWNKGLVYNDIQQINCCETCGVLSNEQSKNERCWRCDKKVEKKDVKQWFIKITKYAKDLYFGLDELDNWPEKIKKMQRQWLGTNYVNFFIPELNKYFFSKDDVETINLNTIFEHVTLEHNGKKRIIKVIKNNNEDIVTTSICNKEKFILKIHDWCISRQRYWGTPINVISCEKCGLYCSNDFEKFKLDSPIEIKCEKCFSNAERIKDTMDTFMSSSWYMWRFIDKKYNKIFPLIEKPVDIYIGGAEHAVMHLLYSRFITRFFFDIGWSKIKEPFNCLINQGMVLGNTYFCNKCNKYLNVSEIINNTCVKCSGEIEKKIEKMSKSKKNGLSADELIKKYSVDTIKMYILSKSPLIDDMIWNDDDISGISNFLLSVLDWSQNLEINNNIKTSYMPHILNAEEKIWERLNNTIETKRMKFNVIVSMIFSLFKNIKKISSFNTQQKELKIFIILLSLFASNLSNFLSNKIFHLDILELKVDLDSIFATKTENIKSNILLNNKYICSIEFDLDETEEKKRVRAMNECSKILGLKFNKETVVFISKKTINIVTK